MVTFEKHHLPEVSKVPSPLSNKKFVMSTIFQTIMLRFVFTGTGAVARRCSLKKVLPKIS